MTPWMIPTIAGLALLIGGWSFALTQYALGRKAEQRARMRLAEPNGDAPSI